MGEVYKRDGDTPSEAWNRLIKRINDELVPECSGVTQLPYVEANHRWKKSDIRTVQDKLEELCESNSFDPIHDIWKTAKINELIAAIDSGACCACPDEPWLLDAILNPSASSLLGIVNGEAGTIFFGEIDLTGLPFSSFYNYQAELDAIRATFTAAGAAEVAAQDALTAAIAGGDPATIAAAELVLAAAQADAELANGVFSRNFWGISRLHNSGVIFESEFGVIKSGILRDPEELSATFSFGTVDYQVGGGYVYNFLAVCQDLTGDPAIAADITIGEKYNDDSIGLRTYSFQNWNVVSA